MKLSKQIRSILESFSTINTNLVVFPGKRLSTVGISGDIFVEYEGEDEFNKEVGIFNLSELLSVLSLFSDPDIELGDKTLTVKEGKQKVTYVYADKTLLSYKKETIKMPPADIEFTLTDEILGKIQKVGNILGVDDLSIIGEKKRVYARVFDSKNPTGNTFDVDLEVKPGKEFNVHFKVSRLGKLYKGDYDVELSSKLISKFKHKALKLNAYVALEQDSKFD